MGPPPPPTRPCNATGDETVIKSVDLPATTAWLTDAVNSTLSTAERSGKIDVLRLAREVHVVALSAAAVTIPVKRVRVTVTPIRGNRRLNSRAYGPLTGKLTVGSTARGKPVVKLNGRPLR